MYRVLGVLSVVSSSIMMGIFLANDLKKRGEILKEIRQAAVYIKSDLEYRAPEIEDCFFNRGHFFSRVAELIKERDLPPKLALKFACEELKEITVEDREIIYSYADNISAEEIGGQIANISQLISGLDEKISAAEREYKEKGRLYRSGGALVGLGIVILLI